MAFALSVGFSAIGCVSVNIHLATTPEEQRQWMEQWRRAEAGLWEQKIADLRTMSESNAAADFDDLDMEIEAIYCSPERLNGQGLIEQQRLFQKMYAPEQGS